jgi:hypothetical protein
MERKKCASVQEMLDDIADPEFADSFRSHMSKQSVRLRSWLAVKWIVFRSRLVSWFGRI